MPPSRSPLLVATAAEAPTGYCVQVQGMCTTLEAVESSGDAAVEYGGCDGVTYEGPCPLVPYRHSGPCRAP